MRTEYLRTAKHSYMMVKDADYSFEQYELQMLVHNDISSMLPLQVMVNDGRTEYCYDVTGLKSLDKIYTYSSIREEHLRFLLNSICDMKQQMEEYLLDDRNIDFSLDKIFVNGSKRQMCFCYIPGYQEVNANDINGLLEEVMQYLDHGDPWAVKVAYDLYEVCAKGEFTVELCRQCMAAGGEEASPPSKEEVEILREVDRQLNDLRGQMCTDLRGQMHMDRGGQMHTDRKTSLSDIFDDADGDVFPDEPLSFSNRSAAVDRRSPFGWKKIMKREKKGIAGVGVNAKNLDEPVYGKRNEKKKNKKLDKIMEKKIDKWAKPSGSIVSQEIDYGFLGMTGQKQFAVAEDDGKWGQTVCYSDIQMKNVWELQYKGDGLEQDLDVSDFPFVIGKERDKVNGVLRAETVSRIHAHISLRDGTLILEDFNSTNGTYLNGHLLPMNTPVEIREGDRIIFATEEFVLKKNMRVAAFGRA